MAVGVSLPIDNHMVEYWMNLELQQLPDDDDPNAYPAALQETWMERLHELVPAVAAQCQTLGLDFSYKMRYIGNGLKVWFAPTANVLAGWTR
jgi:hypothetical protein